MYRIIDGRGTGKTSKLMRLAKERNAIFVCAAPKAMEIKSHAYGITGIRFISYREFNNMLNDEFLDEGGFVGDVVIDELESYINYTLGTALKFVGYSISEE